MTGHLTLSSLFVHSSLEAMKLAYDLVIWFLFYLILAIIARYVPIGVVLLEKPSWDKRGKKVVHLEGKR